MNVSSYDYYEKSDNGTGDYLEEIDTDGSTEESTTMADIEVNTADVSDEETTTMAKDVESAGDEQLDSETESDSGLEEEEPQATTEPSLADIQNILEEATGNAMEKIHEMAMNRDAVTEAQEEDTEVDPIVDDEANITLLNEESEHMDEENMIIGSDVDISEDGNGVTEHDDTNETAEEELLNKKPFKEALRIA